MLFASLAALAQKPNVVVILADDLGYGDLSVYGATDLRTPHIDLLASSGVMFHRAYANCPVCSPTRAALLTGRYPEQVGVPGVIRTDAHNSWGYLAPDAVMLPSVLKDAGYDTAAIGKWHLGLRSENHPIRRGFDHFHGFLGDMMDDYYTHTRHGNHYMQKGTDDIQPEGHATDLFSRWAIDYISGRADQDAPFFLYLAYNAPHTPIQPPKDWLARVQAREPGIDNNRAKLVALIEHMDQGIGNVLTALKEFGKHDNTLVIFVSDNGGQCNVGGNNGALRGCKQEMFEGGIRVPMVAAWPGKTFADSASDLEVMSMDIFATICDAAGAKLAHPVDGQSFLPTLLNKRQRFDRDLFWVRREGGRHKGKTYWAMRRGDWKLLQRGPDKPFELYDLKNDPEERQNQALANSAMRDALVAALKAHIAKSAAVPWQAPK